MRTKMLVAAVVLVSAFGSPALAQTAGQGRTQLGGIEQGVRPATRTTHSVNPGYDVYQNGQYVGSDPDANIRVQLLRERDGTEW